MSTRFRLDQPLSPGTVLLEASAGTGKTYSIAAIALRLVAEEGLAIDELAIVTFTKAATAELRERIRERFTEALAALEVATSGGDLTHGDPVLGALVADASAAPLRASRVQRALADFDRAQISTIHGFCQNLLRSGAFETGAELDVELTPDLSDLDEEIQQDFLHRELVGVSDAEYQFRADLLGLTPERVAKFARTLATAPHARLRPEAVPFDLQRARDALARTWRERGDAIAEWVLSDAWNSNKLKTYIREATVDTLGRWLADEAVPSDALTRVFDFLTPHRFHAEAFRKGKSLPPEPFLESLDAFYEQALADQWARVRAHLEAESPRRKAARRVMSYDDLLGRVAEALGDPSRAPLLRRFVRDRTRAALIDEFQDTDEVQWTIFSGLFGSSEAEEAPVWLYLIGDPKQSIYRFRGADVHTYLDAREQAKAGRYSLSTNWRSDAPLIEALNGLYAGRPEIAPGIDYEPVDFAPKNAEGALRVDDRALPALDLLVFPTRDSEDETAARWPAQITACVAADVVELLSSGATITSGTTPGEAKPVEPADIAVLVDSHAEARAVQRELVARGVPAVLQAQRSTVYETPEAAWLLVLLRAWLHPQRAPTLRAALLSPAFERPAAELADMDESTWDAWVERFVGWSQRWHARGFMSAWRDFVRETDLRARCAAHPGGARRWTNFAHLAEELHIQGANSRMAPAALTRWYEETLLEPEGSDERLLRLDTDAAALSILTVHASKGLEFPIVYYPYAGRAREQKKSPTFPAARMDDGWNVELRSGARRKFPEFAEVADEADEEESREDARKLYVALTRAKHRLTLYWGLGSAKPLARLPLAGLLFPEGDADEKRDASETTACLRAQLGSLADDISLRQPDALDLDARWTPPHVAPPPLAARPFTRAELDRRWRRVSYSSLAHGASFEFEDGSPWAEGEELHPLAPDVFDLEVGPERTADDASDAEASRSGHPAGEPDDGDLPPADLPPADLPPADLPAGDLPLADFPRGAEAGTFMHHFLELLDFPRVGDDEYFDELALDLMRREGVASTELARFRAGIRAMLHTPLGANANEHRLVDVERADRLDEMRFELPIAGGHESRDPDAVVRGIDLARALAESRRPDDAVPQRVHDRFSAMRFSEDARGYLTGSIDLLFRVRDGVDPADARYFVVDYKSNWLGRDGTTGSADYLPHRLVDAMMVHDYHLQYHLYALATHRFLRARMGAAYDYERHFGGVYYLFARGMTGESVLRDPHGRPAGVFFDRPPLETLDALDRLFARRDAPADPHEEPRGRSQAVSPSAASARRTSTAPTEAATQLGFGFDFGDADDEGDRR